VTREIGQCLGQMAFVEINLHHVSSPSD
jgi:hypothetical protein